MKIKCLKCGSEQYIKNGKVFGWQRYKCKECGYQFTKLGERGKSLNLKLTSHALYMFGLSMRQIAQVVGVSAQSVSRWINKWHLTYMSDMGERETHYAATAENLLDILNLNPKEKVMVSSERLSSGAEVHIIIKLP